LGIILFGDQNNVRAIDAFKIYIARVKAFIESVKVIRDDVPAFLKEDTIETIRAWAMVRWHFF
jgi:hypothetical protein